MKRIITFIIVLMLMPATASALDLTEAKQKMLIGETDSGYLAAVSDPSNEVKQLIQSINAKRKQAYESLATKNKVPLAEVEKVAAKKVIDKTPKGQKVRIGGKWHTK